MGNEDLVLKMILDESGFTAGMNSAVKKLGDFDGQVSKTGDKGGRSLGSIWTTFVGSFLASGATKIITTGFGMIQSSISGAISRVDTLNNSNRVFENMGFNAQDTAKTMDALKESINGLPTPLDSAVSNVQLLASSTKDLGKSEQVFSALNNGILGFGGSAGDVDNVVMQLSKSFSAGKIQGEAFNSMLAGKMGPVLNALADQMGITMGELQEGLSKGEISVEQFQNALIDLNKNGGGGLASLEQIAKDATGGIETSFQNMKTAITRGVANIIEAFDEALGEAGFGGISEILGSIGAAFEKGLTKFAEQLPAIISGFQKLADTIKVLAPILVPMATAFGAFMIQLKGIPAMIKTFNNLKTAIVGVGNSLKIMGAIAAANPIVLLVGAIVGAIAVFGYFMATNEEFRTNVISVWNSVKDTVIGALQAIKQWGIDTWDSMKQFAKNAVDGVKSAWSGTKQWFSDIWKGIKDGAKGAWDSTVQAGKDAVTGVKNVWQGIQDWFANLWNGVKETVTSIVGSLSDAIMSRFGMLIYGIRNAFIHMSFFLSTLWENLVEIGRNIFTILKNVILAPVLLVTSMITGGWEETKVNMIAVWNNIKDSAGNIWNSIKAIFDSFLVNTKMAFLNIWNGIKDAVSYIWTTMKTIAMDTFNSVVAFFVDTWTNIKQTTIDTWNNIKESVANTWNSMEQGAIDTFNALKDFLSNLWQSTKDTTVQMWSDTKQAVVDTWDAMKQSVVNIADNMVQGAQKAWENLKQGVSDAVNRVKETFNDLRNVDLFEIGKNIIQGLVDGLASMYNAVKDTITGIADTIKGGIKSALNINSPSRWMRDMIGKNIVLGVVKGIEEEKDTLDNAVNKMTDLPTDIPMVQVNHRGDRYADGPQVATATTSSQQSSGDTYHIHLQAMGEPSEAQMMSWAKTIVKYINEVKERDYAPKGGAFGGI